MTRKEQMTEINRRIAELRTELRKLERSEAEEFQVAHRDNIGRCFKTHDDEYVMITDVPYIQNGTEHVVFNKYQFPAFYVATGSTQYDYDEGGYLWEPFYFDRAFSRDGVSFGNDPVFNETPWEEITLDEFKSIFTDKVTQLWDQVFKAVDGGKA